jgi:hypothetical protein
MVGRIRGERALSVERKSTPENAGCWTRGLVLEKGCRCAVLEAVACGRWRLRSKQRPIFLVGNELGIEIQELF